MLTFIKRLLCRHTHGFLLAIEYDGSAVYECEAAHGIKP